MTAEWNQSRGDGITFGSFHLTRRVLLRVPLFPTLTWDCWERVSS